MKKKQNCMRVYIEFFLSIYIRLFLIRICIACQLQIDITKQFNASSLRKIDPTDRSMDRRDYLLSVTSLGYRSSLFFFVNSKRTHDLDCDRESWFSRRNQSTFRDGAFVAHARLACTGTSTKKGRLDLTVTKTYFSGFLRDTYTHLRVHTLTRACACAHKTPRQLANVLRDATT